MSNRRALGRGLKALIPDSQASDPERQSGLQSIPIASVRPGGGQPRRQFDDAALAELADSIRQHGVLEPIIARPVGGQYELVVGERRWRAA
ncbi:MAG TPA: ParB N-terminal domain-containing protein, partial [Limnochordia bacterium]|nr:ParB N-terminal domain-containing protein [Limnochordia bacterium]